MPYPRGITCVHQHHVVAHLYCASETKFGYRHPSSEYWNHGISCQQSPFATQVTSPNQEKDQTIYFVKLDSDRTRREDCELDRERDRKSIMVLRGEVHEAQGNRSDKRRPSRWHRARESAPMVAFRKVHHLIMLTSSTLVLFSLILTYTLNSRPTSFERFMDSGNFGPRYLLTLLSLLVKSPLLSLSARAMAAIPFRRLAQQPRRGDPDLFSGPPDSTGLRLVCITETRMVRCRSRRYKRRARRDYARVGPRRAPISLDRYGLLRWSAGTGA